MNHDENKPEMQTWIEPELEARVVAWVAGEASAFEAAELGRLIGEKPELAIFKRRIEAVHGLVAEAARPDQAPLRLAPERRAKLLQTIGAPENAAAKPASGLPVYPPSSVARSQNRRYWQWAAGIAACATLGVFLVQRMQPAFHRFAAEQRRMGDGVARQIEGREESAREEAKKREEAHQPALQVQARAGRQDTLRALGADRKAPAGSIDINLPVVSAPAFAPPPTGAPADRFSAARDLNGRQAAQARVGGAVNGVADSRRSFIASSPRPASSPILPDSRLLDANAPDALRAGGTDKDGMVDRYRAGSKPAGEVVRLTPFEVNVDRDTGYLAPNTMSGTRLNSKIEGPPGPITVVSKEQMMDFPAVQMNDASAAAKPAEPPDAELEREKRRPTRAASARRNSTMPSIMATPPRPPPKRSPAGSSRRPTRCCSSATWCGSR